MAVCCKYACALHDLARAGHPRVKLKLAGGSYLSRAGQAHQLCIRDRRQAKNVLNHGSLDFSIQPDESQRIRTPRGRAAAQSERGNVDAERADRRTNLPDHTRYIDVANQKQRSLKWRFEADSVQSENSR